MGEREFPGLDVPNATSLPYVRIQRGLLGCSAVARTEACGLVQFQVQIMRVNGVKLLYAFGEHAVDGRQYPPTHHDIHSPFLFLPLCDSTGLQPYAVDRPAFFSHLGDAQISSSAATEKKEAE